MSMESSSRRRHRSLEARRVARRRWQKHRNRHPNDSRVGLKTETRRDEKYVTVKAPKEFSLVNNLAETAKFFKTLQFEFSHGRNVFVDFERTKEATPDAVLVLVSKITDKRFTRNRATRGSVPEEKRVHDLLLQMGFYQKVQSHYSHVVSTHGLMLKKRSRKVEPDIAREIISFASRHRYGNPRKCPGVYRVLIEVMANTRDHAAIRRKETESWWTAAYFDAERSRACFVFVDNGVGVFRSTKLGDFQKVWGPLLGFGSKGEVLEAIMNGSVGSRTGIVYRGKGLPSIRNVYNRGEIQNLTVITNEVVGNFANGKFATFDPGFDGTLFYWEI